MALRLAIFLLLTCFVHSLIAQDSAQKFTSKQISSKYLDKVSSKTNSINRKLTSQTDKALNRMQRQEEKLKNKLYKIDSIAANNLFSNSLNKYDEFQKKLNNNADKLTSSGLGNYLPYMDSLKTTLSFLEKDGSALISKNKALQEKLKTAMNN